MVGETSAVSGWFFKGAKWGSCGGRSREVVPAPAGFRAKPRGCEGAKEGGWGATRMAFVEEHPAPQRLRGRSHPTGFPTSPNDLPQRRWDAGKPHQTTDALRPCARAGKSAVSPRATSRGVLPQRRRDAGKTHQTTDPLCPCAPAGKSAVSPRAPSGGVLPQGRWDAGKPIKPRIPCVPAPLRENPPPHRGVGRDSVEPLPGSGRWSQHCLQSRDLAWPDAAATKPQSRARSGEGAWQGGASLGRTQEAKAGRGGGDFREWISPREGATSAPRGRPTTARGSAPRIGDSVEPEP